MAATIPDGYRELEPGETIKIEDLICPADGYRFRNLTTFSKCVGKEYKTVGCGLSVYTKVIRKQDITQEQVTYKSVFYSGLEFGQCEQIREIFLTTPMLQKFDGAHLILNREYFKNFYLLLAKEKGEGIIGYTGFTSAQKIQFEHFVGAMEIDYQTLLEFLKHGIKVLHIPNVSITKDMVITNWNIANVPMLQELSRFE